MVTGVQLQEPLERLLRGPVRVDALYLVILKACKYDIDRAIMYIAQARREEEVLIGSNWF